MWFTEMPFLSSFYKTLLDQRNTFINSICCWKYNKYIQIVGDGTSIDIFKILSSKNIDISLPPLNNEYTYITYSLEPDRNCKCIWD